MHSILDLIYPRRCPICLELLNARELKRFVCDACTQKLKYVEPPYCMRCGKHVDSSDQEYCMDCETHRRSYEKGFPAFVYEGDLKQSVMAFKYKNKREFAEFYAESIATRYGDLLGQLNADALIPVPVHKSRYRKRGYNQAALLGKALEKRLRIPCRQDVLVRQEKTSVQKILDPKQRKKNLENAFKRVKNGVQLNTVILVDDIYTSGATIEACSRVLKATGVGRIYYVSICIGNGQ